MFEIKFLFITVYQQSGIKLYLIHHNGKQWDYLAVIFRAGFCKQ